MSHPAPAPVRPRPLPGAATSSALVLVLWALVLGATTGVAAAALRLPATVGALTVEHPGEGVVHIAVAAPDDRAVLPLGALEPGTERAFLDVLDQGDDWVVVVRRPGQQVEVERVERTRDQLEADGWRVVVPDPAP